MFHKFFLFLASRHSQAGFSLHRFSWKSGAGFTLIELLVVVGIMTVVSSVILFNQSSFSNSILLGNLAYDVALSVRTAQTYGIGTRGVSATSFDSPYGIYFNKPSINPNSYLLFTDTNANLRYDVGEPTQTFTFQAGYHVQGVCVMNGATYEADCTTRSVNIVFKRPEPDAIITAEGDASVGTRGGVKIILESPKGNRRYVQIQQSGQIEIQQHND